MRMKRLKWLAFPVLATALAACSGQNPYMVRNTPEYDRVTRGVVGEWAVTEYGEDGDPADRLGKTFEKARASYDFEAGRARYEFWVSRSKIDESMRDWRQKWPDLQVEEYRISVTAPWEIGKDGGALKLGERTYEIAIRGSGEGFDGFYDWERSKFEAARTAESGAASSASGLGGLVALAAGKIAGAAVKSATGTGDLFVAVSGTSTFRFGDDGTLLLCGKGDGAAYRADVTTCEERLRLRRTN